MNWISVEDKKPEISIVVWVKHTHSTNPAVAWLDHNGWWWSIDSIGEAEYFNDVFNYGLEDSPITHWMPFPDLPNSEQDVQASVATEDQSSNKAD